MNTADINAANGLRYEINLQNNASGKKYRNIKMCEINVSVINSVEYPSTHKHTLPRINMFSNSGGKSLINMNILSRKLNDCSFLILWLKIKLERTY